MSDKKKVWIVGQGLFNLYGYNNLRLPALVDLTPTQIENCKQRGYILSDFTGISQQSKKNGLRSISCQSLLKRR